MPDLDVRELDRDDLPDWDALVTGSVQGTVFHRSDWLQKTASLWNHDLDFAVCYDGNALVGGCPLLSVNPYKLVRLVSPPVISNPYGGVVIADLEHARLRKRELHNNRVILSLMGYITRKKYDYVKLVNSPGLHDIRPFLQQGWSPRVYYTYILPIQQEIMERYSKDVRQNIRKAERLGIQTKRQFDPEIFWRLLTETFAKQNLPPPVVQTAARRSPGPDPREKHREMRWRSRPKGRWLRRMSALGPEYGPQLVALLGKYLSTGAVSLLCHDIFADLGEAVMRSQLDVGQHGALRLVHIGLQSGFIPTTRRICPRGIVSS